MKIISNILKFVGPLLITSFLATTVHAETVTYYINNVVGSPVAAMDQSGQVLWRESYNPYGESRENPSQNQNDIGFTGHQKDDVTGLTYMQARYYDPVVGRFYGNDPVKTESHLVNGNIQGFNRFAYANNNPYKYVDPDGRSAALAACTAGPFGCAIGVGLTLWAIHRGVTGTQKALENKNKNKPLMNESSGNSSGTRELGELEPIHTPDHPQNDPEIGDLSDEELEEAINNPKDGEKVKVKGNRVMDGNTRINEAKKREWSPDTEITVEELHNPTIDPDDPLGGYER